MLRPDDLKRHAPAGPRLLRRGPVLARRRAVRDHPARNSPRDRDARFDLALVQFYGGQYTRPRAALEALLAEQYDDHTAMAYSSLLLRAGEFREGWKYYQGRWAMGEPG